MTALPSAHPQPLMMTALPSAHPQPPAWLGPLARTVGFLPGAGRPA